MAHKNTHLLQREVAFQVTQEDVEESLRRGGQNTCDACAFAVALERTFAELGTPLDRAEVYERTVWLHHPNGTVVKAGTSPELKRAIKSFDPNKGGDGNFLPGIYAIRQVGKNEHPDRIDSYNEAHEDRGARGIVGFNPRPKISSRRTRKRGETNVQS